MSFLQSDAFQIILRTVLAVVIGSVIGSERSRHGRAAGPRTHILVCLGACMTSMTSMYVFSNGEVNGDVFRISAQVISGLGFLGAGVIMHKNNSTITGLTTAAGVWATGTIGVALGYGFYFGAAVVTVLFIITIALFSLLERKKNRTGVLYIESDNMYRVNELLDSLREKIGDEFGYQVIPPRSEYQGHIGIFITYDKRLRIDLAALRRLDTIVFTAEE